MQELITNTLNIRSGSVEQKRQEILEYFEKTWAVDEKLYTQLRTDDIFYHRGDPLRHVILFYLGHTAVFFINKLILAKIIHARINPSFESIFAIGVDEMSWDDLDDKNYNWPEVSAVRAYRDQAKKVIVDVIKNTPLHLPIDWQHPFWIILMGIEHERIHLETSSVLIRQLPLNEVVAREFGKICNEFGDAPANSLIHVEGDEVKLGKPLEHSFYGWDNEYGHALEKVSDFDASQFLVSNGEFLAFVEDGGYRNIDYWTEEGWKWRTFKNSEMPLFWRKQAENYSLRLVAEEIPMPWNWPVEVNYLEAKAFCNWKTKKEGKTFRLPTEAEWYRMAQISQLPDVGERVKPIGNINLEVFASPCPVDKFKQGDFYDLTGNVWQWTETPISGFAGFKVHPMYDDFSTPTFDGKHNLIKGGSWISTGNEATLHSRYAFRRHFYQHAGFRYVQSDEQLHIHNDQYESDPEVAMSCDANWGEAIPGLPNFYAELAQLALEVTKDRGIKRVLDMNADTGRLAFELARYYEDVTALDFSARFLRIPVQLKENGFARYIIKDEGDLVHYRDIDLMETAYETVKNRISFVQDNANNMKTCFSGYDMILLPLLLEELHHPVSFLKKIHQRLNKGGILIIASTYDWQKGIAPKSNWPGGFKKDGEPVTSLEGMEEILSVNFARVGEARSIRQVIRKSSRISQLAQVEVTVWQKK